MASENIKFFISTMQYSGFSGVKIHRILTRKHGVQSLMKEYSSGRREGIVDGRKKSIRRKSNIRHDSIDSVKMAIEIDPFLSIKRISKNLDLSHAMVQRIMKDDLGKKSVNAKFVPHDLTIKKIKSGGSTKNY